MTAGGGRTPEATGDPTHHNAECRVPSAECQVPSAERRVPSAECRVPGAGCHEKNKIIVVRIMGCTPQSRCQFGSGRIGFPINRPCHGPDVTCRRLALRGLLLFVVACLRRRRVRLLAAAMHKSGLPLMQDRSDRRQAGGQLEQQSV